MNNYFSIQDKEYLGLIKTELTQKEYERILTWIEALNSGKYEQGRHRLRNSADSVHRYCCLGVANEVCGLGVDPVGCTSLTTSELPLGLVDMSFGTFYVDGMRKSLANLNDTYNWAFDDIAKLLRDQLQFSKVEEVTV